MNERLTPPAWGDYDPNMLINVSDMQYYYENFTEVVDTQATDNKLAISTIDGRVTALEQSIPVGPGGDGAYLHLGGTPNRYPTAEEMVAGDTDEETSFMVIARPDGIYFYNPKSKVVIPPKKGGGTIAVHGQFPQIFDAGHNMTHDGRMGVSGVYSAKVADVGLETIFPSNPACKVLIVVNEDGEEYQTAFSPDGMASRTFRAGTQTTPWVVSSGGSSGGDVTKADLIGGHQLVNWNTLGADPIVTSGDATAANIASSPFCTGQGSNTGKKFIMADIVDRTVSSITSTQVREGRMTFLINLSSKSRSVELTGGCKFNMGGGNTTLKQTIPSKAVWMMLPGIYSSGDKVWTFSGSFSADTLDFKSLMSRVDALEAGGGPGSGGVTDFTSLIDTPGNYTGQGNRFLAVKADETGVEFVTTPSIDTKPLEDRIDTIDQNIVNHVADFELMRDGHIPTSWNGLGARPVTSPNDITVANITESPFVIGTGTVAGKKFILPDIAELGVMSLGAGQVREGRATYLVNLGNVDRIVELSAGCKINMTGGAVFDSQTIPRKTAWMMSPGVFAGDKVWTFLGALSTEALDIEGLVLRLSAVETEVAKKPISSDVEYKSLVSTNNVQNATIGDKDVVIQELLSSSNPNIWLPMIVERTTTPANNQCWVGKRYVFLNRGDIDTVIKAGGTASIVLPDRTTTMNLTLKKGHSVELVTDGDATNGVWVMVRMGPIDDSAPPPATFKDLTDTPNNYTPNQVLRYNASGTAVISSAFDFKNLGDTPSDYSGHKNKMVVVNNGETALEFKAVPDTSGLQSDIDNNYNSIIALQNADTILNNKVNGFSTGASNVTPNSMGIIVSGTSTTITAEIVAATPYLMLPGTTSRDINLPQIVKTTSTTLSSNQVREGRLTYFGNLGSATKTMKLGANQKFYKDNTYFETNIAIPAGKIYMFIPAWFGTQQTWVFVAALNYSYNPAGLSVDTHEEDKVATLEARVAALEALIHKEI